ncbi:MAG TPA: hypothetical protein VKZ68_11245 [Ohtaekwangia sp.]|nr:hypothetical protein [Ohtaekwangia sp.]
MENVGGLLGALIVALVITLFVRLILQSNGPWGTAWSLFAFLFLALWTVSLYVRATGPLFIGIPWLPISFTGVALALLLLAIPNTRRDASGETSATVTPPPSGEKLGRFFWILMAFFVAAIVIGMVNPQMAR